MKHSSERNQEKIMTRVINHRGKKKSIGLTKCPRTVIFDHQLLLLQFVS